MQGEVGPKDEDLRQALLKLIGDCASWELSSNRTYLEVSRGLVSAAHPEETPLVVDPFAGGGSIPLEALRVGCETFASDLNPVTCLILKVMLEDIPRFGPELAEDLRRFGTEFVKQTEKELAEFYPKDSDGGTPIAYLWARTVRCESPQCGAEIPLMRSFWLCKKASRKRALRYKVARIHGRAPTVQFEIFEPEVDKDVPGPTVTRAKATCLACKAVLPPARVQAQISEQKGGANAVFDIKGTRIGGARLLTVVTLKPGEQGRHYRLSKEEDYHAIRKAVQHVKQIVTTSLPGGVCLLPDEPTPLGGGKGAGRAFSLQKYGMMSWSDLFTARQKLALTTIVKKYHDLKHQAMTESLFPLLVSKFSELSTANCPWEPMAECPRKIFNLQAIPTRWEFAEGVVTCDSSGGMSVVVENVSRMLHDIGSNWLVGQTSIADAADSPMPDASCNVWFTDPPYYDAIPYSDLSDFFFVWLKRMLPENSLLRDPFDSTNTLTPKAREIVQDETKVVGGQRKDRNFFEREMARSFQQGRRVLRSDGVGCVVFAHKTTEGWEALLSGMIHGGWVITTSWPIATEQQHRPRARESAALATSVHLVCRPRPENASIGDWVELLRQLPRGVKNWMDRLQAEGIRGADLVFACIGPALEIYSKCSKVVDAEDREIPLGGDPEATEPHKRGYLAYVWEAVGRAALEQVLGTAEAGARNGAAGTLEEDARLTALFLWTLQSTNGESAPSLSSPVKGEEMREEEDEDMDDEEENAPKKKKKGLTLVFDVVRRFAQPLGIHLDIWEDRIIETDKGIVRLLPVAERGEQLFGHDGADLVAERLEREPAGALQLGLFPERTEAAPQVKGKRAKGKKGTDKDLRTNQEATTLDRVHAAMLLQASGRTNALRALLQAEQDRGPDFLRLANALSALYPKQSEEKRLLDAMLLAGPR